MKTNTTIKLQEAIKQAEAFIVQMEKMDDKKLEKHLDLFRQQMNIAYKQKNYAIYELLYEYEKHVIAGLNLFLRCWTYICVMAKKVKTQFRGTIKGTDKNTCSPRTPGTF